MITREALRTWTDAELYEYWQERVAVRFEDGREESIDQARHMAAKELMAALDAPLPASICDAANRFRNMEDAA